MKQILISIQDYEDEKTMGLFRRFKSIKQQGFLSREQLLEVLRWKSPRPLRFYEQNTESEIKEITGAAFATDNESLKIHTLTALAGVNYPSASAILMFYDRTKYPVLDIRVWQQLYKAKLVDGNARGQNFTLKQWNVYLTVIRKLAKDLGLTPRQVEKRLFDHDKNTRPDRLYSPNGISSH